MSVESYLVSQIDYRREQAKKPVVRRDVVEQVRVWRNCDDVKNFDFGAAIRRIERSVESPVRVENLPVLPSVKVFYVR